MHQITVAIYDGDPLSRAGLVGYLEKHKHMSVLSEAASGGGAGAGDVAIVLIDHVDSTVAVRLRKLVLEMEQRVVLITGELDERQLKLVVEAGVHSILWRRQVTEDRLVKVVQSTAQGEGEVPPDLLTRLLSQVGRMYRGDSATPMSGTRPTERELGVLQLVASGFDTREMAEKLCYSERTVKGILHDIMTRMQLRNRAHAVAVAIREGYL
jgi:DNA-binding NarL/FixJ family response regulator